MKHRLAICSRHENLRREIILYPGVPTRHRKELHFTYVIDIGDYIHTQIAYIVYQAPYAFPVSILEIYLKGLSNRNNRGSLHTPSRLAIAFIISQVGIRYIPVNSTQPDMTPPLIPTVLYKAGTLGTS